MAKSWCHWKEIHQSNWLIPAGGGFQSRLFCEVEAEKDKVSLLWERDCFWIRKRDCLKCGRGCRSWDACCESRDAGCESQDAVAGREMWLQVARWGLRVARCGLQNAVASRKMRVTIAKCWGIGEFSGIRLWRIHSMAYLCNSFVLNTTLTISRGLAAKPVTRPNNHCHNYSIS